VWSEDSVCGYMICKIVESIHDLYGIEITSY